MNGHLGPLEGYSEALTPEETEKAFHDIAEVRSLTEFEETGEADFAYSIPGFARFRVSRLQAAWLCFDRLPRDSIRHPHD